MSLNKFVSRVKILDNGCHEWTGGVVTAGYGQLRVLGKQTLAHRFIYAYTHGEIPNGSVVRHTCNNKTCVNIEHLVIGTQKENITDAILAGTHRGSATHCPQGHEYNSENTTIRPNGARKCKACHRGYQRRYKESKACR